jgi:hypothetical protein
MIITTRLREFMTRKGWITDLDDDIAARKVLGRKLIKGKITVDEIAALNAPVSDSAPRREPASVFPATLRRREKLRRHRFRS